MFLSNPDVMPLAKSMLLKRIAMFFKTGPYQGKYRSIGKIKEGDPVRKGKKWFFIDKILTLRKS
jgi:hypothetical protein